MEVDNNLIYPAKYYTNYINQIARMNEYTNIVNRFNYNINPILNMNTTLDKIINNPIDRIIREQNRTQEMINEITRRCNFINKMAFDNRWFPTALNFDFPIYVMYNTLKKIENESDVKRRLDEVIINYYDEEKIRIKISNIENEKISDVYKRIIKESFEEYIDKKYALCVLPLVLTWEGIIKDKYNISPSKTNVKKAIKNSIENHTGDDLYYQFFDKINEYIGDDTTKIDNEIPKRNAYAHVPLKDYPTQKMALNAILITEFLSRLININESNYEGVDDILSYN